MGGVVSSNTATSDNGSSIGSGGDIIQGLLTTGAYVLAVFLMFVFVEVLANYYNRLSTNRTVLIADTVNSDKTITILQNPNTEGSKPVQLSDNERSGVEFSYSFYLNVNPASFQNANPTEGLLHIFHKGYPSQFPLFSPGVYMLSNHNTLRVYMNTYKTWNNYIEVENIPVSKWVHIVIVCKDHSLEIYVNGNIAKKMSFDGYPPYQNYQDICCFSGRQVTISKTKTPSVGDSDLLILGAMKGLMSRLTYFNYAMGYSEISQLMNQGPSSQIDAEQLNYLPPYFSDNWWTHSNTV